MIVDTPYATVRRADESDRQVVLEILTAAFMNDPLACWLFPEESQRGRLQAHFYRPLLVHPAAEAYLAGGHEGASVWLTMTPGQVPAPETGQEGGRLLALGQALALLHPRREPHLYLPCMGVVGGRQGTGLGSAMVRHRLARADADGLPAYLEASSFRSRALYQRHGFADVGEPVRVAGSPPLWPMWRQPHR